MAIYEVETDSGIFEVEVEEPKQLKFSQVINFPQVKAREGLEMLTEKLTPSRADIEAGNVGIGGIAARTAGETLSEVAPSFVSPESIAGGIAFPAIKAVRPAVAAGGRFLGSTAEKLSGLSPFRKGVLQRTFNEPSIPFRRGVEYVKGQYKNLEDIGGGIREELTDLPVKTLVRRAIKMVKSGVDLTADEAQKVKVALWDARKADILDKQDFGKWYGKFKEMAASKYGEISPVMKRAVDAEAIRNVQPLNVHGTPSSFKTALLGGFLPKAAGLASPIVQGGIASGAGATAKAIRPILNLPYPEISRVGSLTGTTQNLFTTPSGVSYRVVE